MFKGPEGPIKAVIVLQKNFRMFKARESYKHLLFLMKKATKIQRRFRLYLFQKQTKDRVEELTNESLFVWKEMMDEFKEKWQLIEFDFDEEFYKTIHLASDFSNCLFSAIVEMTNIHLNDESKIRERFKIVQIFKIDNKQKMFLFMLLIIEFKIQ